MRCAQHNQARVIMCAMLAPLVALSATAVEVVAAGLPQAREWSRERAAHLLRRAGFGGTPEQIDELAAMTVEQAVATLVDYDKFPQTDPDYKAARGPDPFLMREQLRLIDNEQRREIQDRLRRLSRLQMEELRAWWVRRMVRTPRPFEEKMTLFWHGHFTSGYREVNSSTQMYDQNVFLRNQAKGSLRDLLVGISQDPAMLRYLNNDQNRKEAPNENYARELLELFTMGEGNYTEKDIKEAARALTGWTLRGGEFFNARRAHDDGEMTILGRTGHFDGYNLIDIILEQPATARHISRSILLFFVDHDPPSYLVGAFANVLRDNEFDIGKSMQVLLASEAFYDERFRHNMIKSPVELVVGTVRLLEAAPEDLYAMVDASRSMGQELFQPPNVKGWDGGRKWINTATLFTRYNFATSILRGTESRWEGRFDMGQEMRRLNRMSRHREEIREHIDDYPGLVMPDEQVEARPQPIFDPTMIIERHHLRRADRAVNHMIDRLLQMRIHRQQRDPLRDLLTVHGNYDGETTEGKWKFVSMTNAILCMPEYQVN